MHTAEVSCVLCWMWLWWCRTSTADSSATTELSCFTCRLVFISTFAQSVFKSTAWICSWWGQVVVIHNAGFLFHFTWNKKKLNVSCTLCCFSVLCWVVCQRKEQSVLKLIYSTSVC